MLASLSLPLVALAPSASADGVSWYGYEAGLQLAASQNKSVLIDFYADWCGPCRRMDEETYADERVVEKSECFVCVRVNGDERPDLLSHYGVDAYPTTLFLNASGIEVHRVVGFRDAEGFLLDMEKGLAGLPCVVGGEPREQSTWPLAILLFAVIAVPVAALIGLRLRARAGGRAGGR